MSRRMFYKLGATTEADTGLTGPALEAVRSVCGGLIPADGKLSTLVNVQLFSCTTGEREVFLAEVFRGILDKDDIEDISEMLSDSIG